MRQTQSLRPCGRSQWGTSRAAIIIFRRVSPPRSSLPQGTMKRRSQEAPHQSSAAAIHAIAMISPLTFVSSSQEQ